MTISDIAKMAGVSSAAVSRYLNGGPLSEQKRAVIHEVVELLMLLNDLPQESFSEKRQFFSRSQVTAVRAIHDAMIQDLSHHYTLAELSRQFGIAQTSMKLCFKAVYGSSIYQYIKTYRMQTARVLLQDTSRSVTEIAATLGYDNPSKFSEAFKKEYGISPTLFRNSPSELDVS